MFGSIHSKKSSIRNSDRCYKCEGFGELKVVSKIETMNDDEVKVLSSKIIKCDACDNGRTITASGMF